MSLTRSALARIRGALGKVWIGADELGNLAGEHSHPLHALILGAEFLVEDDLSELRHAVFEHHLAVLVEEELGVGEPGTDHPLIAGDDGLAAVVGLEIGNYDEAVGELISAAKREALLMRLHRGREHFRRHLEEALIENAHQHHRPFGEPGILGEQSNSLRSARAFACAASFSAPFRMMISRSFASRMTKACRSLST